MEKKHFGYLILIIFLLTSVILAFIPILITDKSSKIQSSEESTVSDKKSPQSPLTSTWIANGTPVCTEGSNQLIESICSGGNGDVIIAWLDSRTGWFNRSVYVQKINSTGDIQWTSFPDGVPIWTNTSTNMVMPQICNDGTGGAIITWMDNRSGRGDGDIYAQRINSTGDLEWTSQGVPICNHSSIQGFPQIISLVGGGALIAWEDNRFGNVDIFAQKIGSDGNRLWPENGRPVCTQDDMQLFMSGDMCSDGVGGAIITWVDLRNPNHSVYAQKIDSNGDPDWDTEGVAICTITGLYSSLVPAPNIISDGGNGAIIAWTDNRTSGVDDDTDIYAQSVNSSGDILWDYQGKPVCTEVEEQDDPEIVYDDAGGAIIVWQDSRSSITTSNDVYAQKIDSKGDGQWTPNGTAVCTAEESQGHASICNDGAGGAFVVWEDARGTGDDDIYAQHINSKGIPQWTANGTIICNENDEQENPEIISTGVGSAIIVWGDRRSSNNDIYASRVKSLSPSLPPRNGDDDDDDDDEEVIIPGYDLHLFLLMIGIISVIMYLKKQKNNLKS